MFIVVKSLAVLVLYLLSPLLDHKPAQLWKSHIVFYILGLSSFMGSTYNVYETYIKHTNSLQNNEKTCKRYY